MDGMGETQQKGGKLVGGAATEEALLSSKSVLSPNRAGRTTGLQQYFSPEALSTFIAHVTGTGHQVLDLGAGGGHLLSAFDKASRFGVELDEDQVRSARFAHRGYCAIQGDVQHVFPLLRGLGVKVNLSVSNPAFGLEWAVPGLGKGSSTELTVRMMDELLADGGLGVLVCGKERFEREVRPLLGERLFAVIEVERLFPGVKLSTAVAFWRKAEVEQHWDGKTPTPPPLEVTVATVEALTGTLAHEVRARHAERFPWWNTYPYSRSGHNPMLANTFATVQEEHHRRTAARLGRAAFTAALRGGKRITVSVSGFTRLALEGAKKREAIGWLETFNGQTTSYFALQNREWLRLRRLAEDEALGVTLEPALVVAVEDAIRAARRAGIPLYPIAPAQRLGFLDDLDRVHCRKEDVARGFVAGTAYALDCKTAVLKKEELKDRQTVREGVVQAVPTTYLVERKAMEIQIGEQKFTESAEDITYLLEHFDIPDPGDIEQHFPQEVAFWRGIIRRIELEIRKRVPDFHYRDFQVEDMARLLVKGGGVLAWEQGLGKCVRGDSLAYEGDTLRTFQSLWDVEADASSVVMDAEGGEWATPKRPLTVAALGEDGRMAPAPVGRLYRQWVNEPLRTIRLDDGSSLTTTAVHRYYNGREWTAEVRVGDVLCVPSILPHGTSVVPLDVARMVTWLLSEGCEEATGQFIITQVDRSVLDAWRADAATFMAREGVNLNSLPIRRKSAESHIHALHGWSVAWRDWLIARGYRWGQRSAGKALPDFLMRGTAEVVAEVLRAYFEAEGSVRPEGLVEVSTASKLLAEQVRHLLRRFGIWARLKSKKKCATNGKRIVRTYYQLSFGGEDLRLFRQHIGFLSEQKNAILAEACSRKENSNWRGVPVTDIFATLVEATGIPRKSLGWRGASFKGNLSRRGLESARHRLSAVADGSFLTQCRQRPTNPKQRAQVARLEAAPLEPVRAAHAELERRCQQDVHYARVVAVEWEHHEGYVYDLEVPGPHNFVAHGLLAHNTIGQAMMVRALELAGRVPDECALFAMPQDLVQQFTETTEKFFGRKLVPVANVEQALAVRRQVERRRAALRRGDTSVPGLWAVTWFEALAVAGREVEEMPLRVVRHLLNRTEGIPRHSKWSEEKGRMVIVKEVPSKQVRVPLTSAAVCPECFADAGNGWGGGRCKARLRYPNGKPSQGRRKVCGYVDRRLRVKPAYDILSSTFRTVCVDEGTKIAGDDSLTSKAVRALRAEYRLLATGTPIKNFVSQLYWLLWWALGDSSARFPYSYNGGRELFEKDFAVIETRKDDETGKKTGRPRTLPEVTNLARLWKMLASSVVRRRMDEVGALISEDGEWTCKACKAKHQEAVRGPRGEWIHPSLLECKACKLVADAVVPLKYVPVRVPMGVAQLTYQAAWLNKTNFVRHFKAKFPDHPLVRAKNGDALITLNAACLGQLAKLGYAAIDPTGDPDSDYQGPGLSPWTPGRLEVLRIAEESVREGKRVVIGSCHVAVGAWLAAELCKRGVRAIHITDTDATGKVHTIAPKKRAKLLGDFRNGRADVACVSAQSVALGHNFDVASVFIGYGLPWDHSGWDQLLKRVRRLSSRAPVTAYIILPVGSVEERKWKGLQDKNAAADLALDGKVIARREAAVDFAAVLEQMQRAGASFTGNEVPEAQVQEMWERSARAA